MDVTTNWRISKMEQEERKLLAWHDLLGLSKALVRNLSVAITETATPALRRTFTAQLLGAIHGHERVFNYMHKHGYYPAYDLGQLLGHDIENAQKALKMGF
jgi:spore coat protein F